MPVVMPDEFSRGALPTPEPAQGVAAPQASSIRAAGVPGGFIEKAGAELRGIADVEAHQNMQIALDAANRLGQEATNLAYDPKTGYSVAQGAAVGRDPQAFIKNYTDRLQDAQKAIADSLPNDGARQYFQLHAQAEQAKFMPGLLKHTAEQTMHFNDSVDNDAISNQVADAARHPGDTAWLMGNINAITHSVDNLAIRHGFKPDPNNPDPGTQQVYDSFLRSKVSAAAQASVMGMIDQNPIKAGEIFKSLDDHAMFEPHVRIQLQNEIDRASGTWNAHAIGNKYADDALKGVPIAGAFKAVQTAVEGTPPLSAVEGAVLHNETPTQTDIDPKTGKPYVSPKGAQYAMQVMPDTAANPGLGVKPAADNSPAEVNRVGRDYLGALYQRYNGNPVLTMASYNAGYGVVDDWMNGTNTSGKNPSNTRLGDPRTGQVSMADFVKGIPFAETKDYVQKGLARISGTDHGQAVQQAAQTGQAPNINGMTVAELSLWRDQKVNEARREVLDATGNPIRADEAAGQVHARLSQLVEAKRNTEQANMDTLAMGLRGPAPDGSQAPQSLADMLTNPAMAEAYRNASPENQLHIIQHFKSEGKDGGAGGEAEYHQIMGNLTSPDPLVRAQAINDWNPLAHPNIPVARRYQLENRVDALRSSQNKADALVEQTQHLMKIAEPVLFGSSVKPKIDQNSSADTVREYGQFSSQLLTAVQGYIKDHNGKVPDDNEIKGIAASLLSDVSGTKPGILWGTNEVHGRLYQLDKNMTKEGVVMTQTPPKEFVDSLNAVRLKQGKQVLQNPAAASRAWIEYVREHGYVAPR